MSVDQNKSVLGVLHDDATVGGKTVVDSTEPLSKSRFSRLETLLGRFDYFPQIE